MALLISTAIPPLAAAVLVAGCAAGHHAPHGSVGPLDLGAGARTIAVAPFLVTDEDHVPRGAEELARELARDVEESLLGSRARALITDCAFPCEAADVTLMVGYEARLQASSGPTLHVLTDRAPRRPIVWVDDLPAVNVVVVARVIRSDGTLVDQRQYLGRRTDLSGRHFGRPLGELTRGALADATRQLTDDLAASGSGRSHWPPD